MENLRPLNEVYRPLSFNIAYLCCVVVPSQTPAMIGQHRSRDALDSVAGRDTILVNNLKRTNCSQIVSFRFLLLRVNVC